MDVFKGIGSLDSDWDDVRYWRKVKDIWNWMAGTIRESGKRQRLPFGT